MRSVNEDSVNERDRQGVRNGKRRRSALEVLRDVVEVPSETIALYGTDVINQYVGFWERDLVKEQVFVSRGLLGIFGIDSSEFHPSHENLLEFIKFPQERRSFEQLMDTALTGGTTFKAKFHIVRPDGEVRQLYAEGEVVRDNDQRPLRILGVTVDLTFWEQTGDALRRSEGLFRGLLESAPDGMVIVTEEGEIAIVNSQLVRMTGYKRAELIGQRVELLVPARFRCHHEFRERYFEKPQVRPMAKSGTLFVRRKNGSEFPAEISLSPMLSDTGLVVSAAIRDITERTHAQEALIKSEERLSRAFQSSPVAVVISGLDDGLIRFFNPAFARLSGYPPEEILGKSTVELNLWDSPKDRDILLEVLRKEGECRGLETTTRRKSGELVPISLSSTVIEMDGETCMASWVHDLSALKRAEQEQRKLQQQLFHSRRMDAIGELTGGIAHDFNNILASMLGYTSLAQRRFGKEIGGKLEEYLKQIKHGGERASTMIEQMLAYSRSMPSEVKAVRLQPIIQESVKLLRPLLPSSIDVQAQLREAAFVAKADAAQLGQSLVNLCINARDAMESRGRIVIDVYVKNFNMLECASCHQLISGNYTVLTLTDTGSGIAPQIESKIFDPFFSTKGVGRGTGMGLSMVHGFMHEWGGHISVDSSVGVGTAFSLLFPVVTAEEAANEGIIEPIVDLEEIGAGNVMLIDDEPSLASYLKEMLETNGYKVTLFTDGRVAVDAFRRSDDKFDIVIADQTMPGMTGLEIARELTACSAAIPVIITTGDSEQINNAVLREAGVRALFKKPINDSMLLGKIKQILLEKRAV
jgi:PAS domain S-box-containing protein